MENIVVYLDKKLGEGAFGEVYKGTIRGPIQNPKISFALQHTLGVTVAIKVLKRTYICTYASYVCDQSRYRFFFRFELASS